MKRPISLQWLQTAFVLTAVLTAVQTVAAADVLENESVRADFDAHGLASIADKVSGRTVRIGEDDFAVVAGDDAVESEFLTPRGGRDIADQPGLSFSVRGVDGARCL